MSEEPVSVLLGRMSAAARAESRSAAQRLVAIADLAELRTARDGGATDDWAVDVVDAVAVEVSAELCISKGLAAAHLRYAHALRHQLPHVGAAFVAGDIDEATFRACVFRTGLIVDDDVLASVDRRLAVAAPRWGSTSRSQLASRIDTIVAQADKDAVRRRKDRVAGRDVVVGDVDNGLAEIQATVYAPTGHAVAEALTALAATVCEDDPRTVAQRRADAFDALAARADRMACRCGNTDCPAGGKTASVVVIHVIAERATVDGIGPTAAAMLGYEGLLPAEVVADLAQGARQRSLVHPGDAAAEAGYVPSRGLAEFVWLRDLTCRFPGCDVPASRCDIDHVIPYGVVGRRRPRTCPASAGPITC